MHPITEVALLLVLSRALVGDYFPVPGIKAAIVAYRLATLAVAVVAFTLAVVVAGRWLLSLRP